MRASANASPASTRVVSPRRTHSRRASSRLRAVEGDDSQSASTSESFSLVPKDASDGLSRYRAVLGPLFFAGGALHVPDLFGSGVISSACGVDAFSDLSTPLQALTALWAFGGPATALGLANASFVGDVGVTVIASTEIILGIDFPDLIAPAELPTPIVAAQIVNLCSLVALRAWETSSSSSSSEKQT